MNPFSYGFFSHESWLSPPDVLQTGPFYPTYQPRQHTRSRSCERDIVTSRGKPRESARTYSLRCARATRSSHTWPSGEGGPSSTPARSSKTSLAPGSACTP